MIPQSIRIVGHGFSVQQRLKNQNGHPVSAIESACRFDGANESETKAIVLSDSIAPSCPTFSSDHILIYYTFSATIAIFHGNHEGYVTDDLDASDDVRQAACQAATAPRNHLLLNRYPAM